MKTIKLILLISVISLQQMRAQQATDHKKEIRKIIDVYSQSVNQKDSAVFYDLFNSDTVTWCAALKDRSQAKELEKKGALKVKSNYFSGSYKGFFRSLFRYGSTEDRFDNIRIAEDGTVATVTMDYSFWADHKMTNWGGKYLTLIKKDGKWKITSVIYSVELSEYFKQPSLKDRQTETIIQVR